MARDPIELLKCKDCAADYVAGVVHLCSNPHFTCSICGQRAPFTGHLCTNAALVAAAVCQSLVGPLVIPSEHCHPKRRSRLHLAPVEALVSQGISLYVRATRRRTQRLPRSRWSARRARHRPA
jgi:hypothetical protein